MSHVKLQVAGIGYDGAPAGRDGEQYDAGESGTERDRVFYKVSTGGGLGGAIRELFFERVESAYLDAQSRSSLDNMGVVYRNQDDVRNAGMSNYVLWQVNKDTGSARR